jgi:aminopeptidase N
MFQLEPATWDLQASFPIECRNVFDSDADETAHPLHIDMRHLSELAGVFDLTSYVKGNCMARMIYHFLGERIFLSSVRRYMRTYYYRSADQEDLWSAFQAEIDGNRDLPVSSGLSMKDIMRTWTHQAGLPVLRVRQEHETGAVELTQVRPRFRDRIIFADRRYDRKHYFCLAYPGDSADSASDLLFNDEFTNLRIYVTSL